MTMHEDAQGDPTTYTPNPRPMIAWARRVLDEAWGEANAPGAYCSVQEKLQAAQTMATLAQAAALLQPTPEEILSLYEGMTTEVDSDAGRKLEEVLAILDETRRDGSRRHPAILAALNVIEGS